MPDNESKPNPSGLREFRSRTNFLPDLGAFVGDCSAQVILSLKADQKAGGDAKVALETQRGVGRDAFSSGKDIAETAAGNGHVPGRLGCRDSVGFQFIVDEPGGGVGAEFHRISGCLQF